MKTLGWAIAVSALLITIPRYVSVFGDIDDLQLTAWGMGILLAGGSAYIFHAWAKTKRGGSWMLLVAFCLNLAYEPFIVSPFVLSRLHGMTLAQAMSPGYAVFWSIIVAAAPVVLVGGVVLAISFQKEKRTQVQRKSAESAAEEVETSMQGVEAMTKMEQARQIAELHPEWNLARIAQEVGCSASTVTRALMT